MTTPRRRAKPRPIKPGSVGPGIKPTVKAAARYEGEIRRKVLLPFTERIDRRITSAGQNYRAIREAIADIPQDPRLAGLSANLARDFAEGIKAQHTADFRKKMGRYLGVNIGPLTPDIGVMAIMEERIVANAELIKTIPERYHRALREELLGLADDAPFDQAALRRTLNVSYGSSGYNLRRLTRDQTSKTIGALTQARQSQVGVKEYIWRTSNDERVRRTHRDKDGKKFSWDSPPPDTGHPGEDIQCRCIALPVIPETPIRPVTATPPPSTSIAGIPTPPNLSRPQTGPEARRRLETIAAESEAAAQTRLAAMQKVQEERLSVSFRLERAGRYSVDGERLSRRLKTLDDQIKAFRQEQVQLADELIPRMRREVLEHGQELPTINYRIIGAGSKDPRNVQAVEEGIDAFRRMVRRWGDEKRIEIDIITRPTRSYYSGRLGQRYIQTGGHRVGQAPKPQTIVHEMGHAYEDTQVARLQSAVDHMYSRTSREGLKSMRDVSGRGYRANELSRPNEFYDAYVGKSYPINPRASQANIDRQLEYGHSLAANPYKRMSSKYLHATEVTSMALEEMYANPLNLARQDPRLFDWVFNTVMR